MRLRPIVLVMNKKFIKSKGNRNYVDKLGRRLLGIIKYTFNNITGLYIIVFLVLSSLIFFYWQQTVVVFVLFPFFQTNFF